MEVVEGRCGHCNRTVSTVGGIFFGPLIFTGGMLLYELVSKTTSLLQYVSG
jgi:hypothetical protein